MKIIFFILVLITLTGEPTKACSYISAPLVEIRDKEFVFLGEIVGYVGPIKSTKILRDAWGVKVKMEQSIQLPKPQKGYIEVFPLGLTNACELTGSSKERLQKYYPIGAKVRVAGLEGNWMDGNTTNNQIRLVLTEMNHGLMARNDLKDGFDTTADLIYNYKKDRTHTRKAQDSAAIMYYYAQVGDFELRKDFIRLLAAKTENEKHAILKRLADYSYYEIIYDQLVKAHLKNEKLVNDLLKMRPR